MKKVLVTGASGFIGYHVIENLINSNFKVLGVDINEPENPQEGCKYLKKNVSNLNEEDINDCDFIIHLACDTNIKNSIENPVPTTDNNLGLTIKLLSLAFLKVIYAKCYIWILRSSGGRGNISRVKTTSYEAV